MSAAKHTPGPWVVSRLSDLIISAERSDHQSPLACVYGPAFARHSEVGQTAIADARLIAAAPELFAALEGLMELERRGRLMPIGREWDAARAAIAKATGGNDA